ncbi:carbohydrate kinase [soil metagenome]
MTTANDVACFGELLWDFFEHVAPDAKPDKEPIARTFRREIGGASANVALSLARLGVKVAAVGAVGDDKLGDALRAELAASGVDVTGVARLKHARTGITFVTRDAAGEPSFVPYRQGTADLALDEAHVASGSAKVRFAVVCSTSMLPPLRDGTLKFLAALDKAKGALVVDLNVRQHLWSDADSMRAAVAELASRAAVVKGSEKDLGALAGKRGMTWLEDNAKGATWVLTRGENGAACVGPHGQVTFPTKRVRCIDATGAGDAFMAGLVAVLVRSGAKPGSAEWKDPKLWSRAMEVGHLLGAKAISAVGATAGLGKLDDLRTRIDAPKK